MITWLLLLLAVGICLFLIAVEVTSRSSRMLAQLPCFKKLPLLGNLHQLMGDGAHIFNILSDMSRVSEETALPFVLWMGPKPVLLVSEPEDVRLVTNTFIEKPHYYSFGRIWLGNGLVTAPGAIWKHNIKKLAGTFTGSIVEGYQCVFNAQARKLVDKLRHESGKQPFDIMHNYLAYTTLETICQTALGVPRISESIVTTEYYQAFNRTLELLFRRGLNLFLHPEVLYQMTPASKELEKCVAILHNVSATVMNTRRKEMEEQKKVRLVTPKVEGIFQMTAPHQSLSHFSTFSWNSETDPTLTDKQIQSEVDTIIVGGQETVASTLYFTLLMIGCQPKVQEKMFAELHEIFGDDRRDVQKEDLQRMQYCEGAILETLRLYPPVPAVMRHAHADLKIKSCTIPKGTAVCVNGYAAGRSPRFWGKDVMEFRPERWTDGSVTPAAGFLAFSYGKRACIGKRYAMAILKTVLAHCIREFTFTSEAQNIKFKLDIALKPISGHLVEINLRK